MIRLGGPVFVKSDDPEEVAREHVRWGYQAAYCPPVEAGDSARLTAIREAFARHDVVVAEVGAWRNLIPPDETARRESIRYVCERLSVADEVGALCCVDFAGTRRPGVAHGPHPENFSDETFDLIVVTVREILQEVAPKRARFGLEMMQTVPPDTVGSYEALIEAIDHPAFAVHLDPVNILYSPRQCHENDATIRECIERLGPKIVSCHAKDLVVRDGLALHVDECRPGTGLLDYRAYVAGLLALDRDIPLMLEHLKGEDEYRLARDFIRTAIDASGGK